MLSKTTKSKTPSTKNAGNEIPMCGKSSRKVSLSATTLLLSSPELVAAPWLAAEARNRNWRVEFLTSRPRLGQSAIFFYGSTLDAEKVSRDYDLALLGPPLDLLAHLPSDLLLRHVEFRRWDQIPSRPDPMFIKPADPIAKTFDAGLYRGRETIPFRRQIPAETPVLISEPAEWLIEYRCFVLEGNVVATSPYLSFGRPLHHTRGRASADPPAPVLDVCRRLAHSPSPKLPPAFVIDIGLIEDRGWAVIEFNPAWCAGLLSADPALVIDVLHRSCRPAARLTQSDRQWFLKRPVPQP